MSNAPDPVRRPYLLWPHSVKLAGWKQSVGQSGGICHSSDGRED